MSFVNAHNAYKNVAAQTVSRERRTLMLYDGALKFTSQALLALEANQPMQLTEAAKRALDIIVELQTTLDHKHKIADEYAALYDYIKERLVTGSAEHDKSALTVAQSLLREFRDMWREAMRLGKIQ